MFGFGKSKDAKRKARLRKEIRQLKRDSKPYRDGARAYKKQIKRLKRGL